MTEKELIKKIKSRGYWKVDFRPLTFDKKRIPDKKQLMEFLEKSSVRLRGWDYPHISHWDNPQSRRPIVGGDFVEGGSDWGTQIEFWRMYQSGQFVHLFALNEDWWGEDDWYASRSDLQKIKSGEILSIISALYTVIEIFEFAHRLVKLGIYDEGIIIFISIENTRDRKLEILDLNRAPLFGEYKSYQDSVSYEKGYSKEELLNSHKDYAIDVISQIFESFNWLDSPRNVFEEDLKKLYSGRG